MMLQVLLFNSERNWAHAMEIKQKAQLDKDRNSRRKFFITKKFRKAEKWAQKLKEQTIDRTEKVNTLLIKY
jgi:hypothetical protein